MTKDNKHKITIEAIEHLSICELHNPNVCDLCFSVNERFTKNGYGYINFLDILKQHEIEQKVYDKL